MSPSPDSARVCAAPDCDVRFTPKRADQKYHSPECRRKAEQRSQNARRIASRKRTCVICGQPFTARDTRYRRCESCAETCVITVSTGNRGTIRWVRVPASGKLPPHPQLFSKTCAECGTPFVTANKRARYCRPACVYKAWYARTAAYRRNAGQLTGK